MKAWKGDLQEDLTLKDPTDAEDTDVSSFFRITRRSSQTLAELRNAALTWCSFAPQMIDLDSEMKERYENGQLSKVSCFSGKTHAAFCARHVRFLISIIRF